MTNTYNMIYGNIIDDFSLSKKFISFAKSMKVDIAALETRIQNTGRVKMDNIIKHS